MRTGGARDALVPLLDDIRLRGPNDAAPTPEPIRGDDDTSELHTFLKHARLACPIIQPTFRRISRTAITLILTISSRVSQSHWRINEASKDIATLDLSELVGIKRFRRHDLSG
jgi:hypothetical protein